MAKLSVKESSFTSFHRDTIICSVNDLKKLLGEPEYACNTGEDKINYEWNCETDDGDVFTIYDYKQGHPIQDDEHIEWHLGGHEKRITNIAKIELNDMLYIAAKGGIIE